MSSYKAKLTVHPDRVRMLKSAATGRGPVVYWMSRDQRLTDNWALLYSQQLALEMDRPLAIAFNLVPDFLGATSRQYDFMLEGLKQLVERLAKFNIAFHLTIGEPSTALVRLLVRMRPGAVITDFAPLRLNRTWKSEVMSRIDTSFYEVDAHNIVPAWKASDKQEYAAYTFRPKIHRYLPEFLTEFPRLRTHPIPPGKPLKPVQWKRALSSLRVDTMINPVNAPRPGEDAAKSVLRNFLKNKLPRYADLRNDPTADAQSWLSPYLHFGQISAQRVALEVQKHDRHIESQEAFLEELIVRRELSDNFCFYNDKYDSVEGFPGWARESLNAHRSDPREYLYSLSEFEKAETYDDLWNAAQMEMVRTGKMHGYLRMYWAKKILQWSPSPEEALKTAIYLNDRYELDGRDPNGYTGIAWSIGGLHDRPWFERDIFGKVRYMSRGGCDRKFDTAEYVRKMADLA
ncbi:MAG: deoxyribodipyrimidine photo-lyase [Candidatus Zixiibacteriota bacterium]|nr:MAG: deoxyribodipyrimidine photo-lyase [candidate division Zixibacteria bacterium]